MQLQNFYAQDVNGNIVPGAICSLFLPGTTTLATGLVDANGVPLPNPFSASSNGLVQFAAPNGKYDLKIEAGLIVSTLPITFADTYQALIQLGGFLPPSAMYPATRSDGTPLQLGDRFMKTPEDIEYIYKTTGWEPNNLDGQLLADPGGADLVGWERNPLSSSITTVGGAISAAMRSIWEYAYLVTDKPAPSDPNTWDWSPAVQAHCAIGGDLRVSGLATVIIDSVSVTTNVHIYCDSGTRFLRKAGSDGPGSSYWAAGAAMFELDAPALNFEVSGYFVYDGNSANQTTMEPTGFFVKAYPTTSISSNPTVVTIRNGRFVNGTSGYVLMRGDNYQRRYATICNLINCNFQDTVYGIGRGDPSTQTPLGYSPTYVYAMDYVFMNTQNFRATFSKPLSTGKYSVTALLGTYYGQDFSQSGECIVTMIGTTYIEKMGRGGPGWDGNWATEQNGIGCIDIYGNGESLYIEKLVAEGCYSIPARAKASLRNFTIVDAVCNDCVGGVQVSPSSTGPAECVVSIGTVVSSGCNMPVVEFVGTGVSDRVPDVRIGLARIMNTLPPANTAVAIIAGAMHIRNVGKVAVSSLTVETTAQYGASFVDVDDVHVNDTRMRAANGIGMWSTGCRLIDIDGFDIQNTASGPAITIASTTGIIDIKNGFTSGSVDYGIFCNATAATEINIENVFVQSVSGLSRGFYSPNGFSRVYNCSTGTGVTTPLLSLTASRCLANGNSWQPAVFYGGATAPTSGTYKQSDISINQFYAGTGTKQFRCTVAGQPGTWVAET